MARVRNCVECVSTCLVVEEKCYNEWLRMLAFVLPPLLHFLGFTAASVLSAQVAAPNYSASQVKHSQNNCGYWIWTQPTDPDQQKTESRVQSMLLVKMQ